MSTGLNPRRLAAGVVLALIALNLGVAPRPAAAWYAGYCKGSTGVTVVVDYQALGGGTLIRCADTIRAGDTGFDALHQAGFTTQGTSHDGDGFICRISGRPSPTETIPVKKFPNYRERCIDTPPAAAYWSYWHADNGGSWSYSNYGAKNRAVIIGGFEGWSFSLNATASTNPRPRVAPNRPAVPVATSTPAPPAPVASRATVPPQTPPRTSQPVRTTSPTKTTLPTPLAPTGSASPTVVASPDASAHPSGTAASGPPSGPPASTPPEASDAQGVPTGTIIGVAVVGGLAAAALGVVAWRRRHSD